jgi:hypothetical protein
MLRSSHYSFSPDQEQPEVAKEACISQEERVRELEAEVNALQELVCYLLEKNEYLRVRLQMS